MSGASPAARADDLPSTSRPTPSPAPAPAPPPRPAPRPPPPAIKEPPFFYKPLKSRDFRVTYDPALDRNPIKKGKQVVQRWDGEGVEEEPKDPRKAAGTSEAKKPKKGQLMRKVAVVSYNVRPWPFPLPP